MRKWDEIINVSEIRRGAAWHVTTENGRSFDIHLGGQDYHVMKGNTPLRKEERFCDAVEAIQFLLDKEFLESIDKKAREGKAL